MRKLMPTLSQRGLLAVLRQCQRYKVTQSALCSAHRKQRTATFWSSITWPFRALTARTLVDDSAKPWAGTVPRRT